MCNYKIVELTKDNISYYLDSLITNYTNAKVRLKKLTTYQWQDITYDYSFFYNMINNKEKFVMLTLDNEVIASMRLLLIEEPTYDEIYDGSFKYSNYSTIHTICVSEDYLRRGYGIKLLDLAKRISLDLGYDSIRIDTHPKNEVMKSLCKKCGYEYSGIIYLSFVHDDNTIRYVYEILL